CTAVRRVLVGLVNDRFNPPPFERNSCATMPGGHFVHFLHCRSTNSSYFGGSGVDMGRFEVLTVIVSAVWRSASSSLGMGGQVCGGHYETGCYIMSL